VDKRTLLAVVLSVIIVSVSFVIQNILWPVEEQNISQQQQQQDNGITVADEPVIETPQDTEESVSEAALIEETAEKAPEKTIVEENDIFVIEFSSRGGEITSLQLKEHQEDGQNLEMINRKTSDRGAFSVHFGGLYSQALNQNFHYRKVSDTVFEFYQSFKDISGNPFLLKKTYRFLPGEYLMELAVTIEGANNKTPDLNFNGSAYHLEFGPQIGPQFDKLDGRKEFRKYYAYVDGKREKVKLKDDEAQEVERVTWAAIDGKYFSVIAVPDSTPYIITWSEIPVPGVEETSRLIFSRPVLKASRSTDLYRFYIGPKSNGVLASYNEKGENAYGISRLNMDELIQKNFFMGALEGFLKFFLELFYSIVHNYGVAIILLTVLVRGFLYPITRKSYQSTAAMQKLQPKIAEIREKYKDDPNKMNGAMAELYKKEGVNPVGGCLPMVLQLPIFIALYGLLNTHFDLRGAEFITPWISDLSAPETVFSWSGLSLPVMGNEFRILPFLMILTQILMTKMTQSQSAAGANNSQMKMLTYGMPIFFFFIMYDMPSGLLLYWTVTNVLTAIQQIVINRISKKKTA